MNNGDAPLLRLQAWRDSGAAQVDPVRFRWIEALARRAADHDGPVRQRLDERLTQLLDDYARRIASAPDPSPPPQYAPNAVTAPPGPLAGLVAYLARQGSAAGEMSASAGTALSGALASVPAPAELKTLSRFRSTWVRLSARQRLAQVRAQVPENAGPLNTQQLVHRSLGLMQQQSAGYLEHFMAYLDTLILLEQALDPPLPAATAPRHDAPRKSTRGR